MKVVVLLGDGMADRRHPGYGDRTALEAAHTPEMDALARQGDLGLARTVPPGLPPGSDVANLSVLGYDPARCYTGRAPLEAAAMGVELGPDDVAYRMNLVTLLPGTDRVYMHDFSAGHISSEEARAIVQTLARELGDDGFEFYPGVGYRHLMVWRNGRDGASTTPPHDIQGQPIHEHLPRGEGAEELVHLITGSQILLKDHPVNRARRERGQKEANSVWLWGQGRRPTLEPYRSRFGLSGAVVSAVDLLKGIAHLAGLDAPRVPGATGYLDTDYEGKVTALLAALDRGDFGFVHVEAPDEAAHAGNPEHKVRAIEDFDARVVGPVRRALEERGEPYRLLVLPDHPTPLELRTHTDEPVPFVLYDSTRPATRPGAAFTEAEARATGLVVDEAHRLVAHMSGRVRLW
ncbi:cofactor-independent phosphoglycerate mutase [Deferrisoma camini]|uniref:cofactor-independent phosphoglycerate mutase n=1 Tax=Deferrisoma camini TaxID=1035120 RepID=UPI00046C8F16|nr:cofactor-independent phosphoglycerate mutase [Deferrisoma camini]